jgi:predicted metal-dependent hydrolase
MSRPGAKASSTVQLLKVDGIAAPVELRRHPTARRLTLRVSRTERSVVITMPRSCDFKEANRFLSRSLDWVHERLKGVPEPVRLQCGAMLPLRGVPHEVQFIGAGSGRPVVEILPSVGRRAPVLAVAGAIEHAPRRLRDWLMAEAGRDLDQRVTHHTTQLGLRAKRITLRDQKSRWGSCSSSGHLSFSWRLILAPSFVLDYVAAHEVAHLAEMNHGPRFWRLVERAMPRLEEAKVWLRLHGMDLYRYGSEE